MSRQCPIPFVLIVSLLSVAGASAEPKTIPVSTVETHGNAPSEIMDATLVDQNPKEQEQIKEKQKPSAWDRYGHTVGCFP